MALFIVLLIVAAILVATWRLTTLKADATRTIDQAKADVAKAESEIKP